MSGELKPCPFCGEPAKMETITDIFHHTTFMVTCGYGECLVHPSSYPCEKRADAVYTWNRRAGEPGETLPA